MCFFYVGQNFLLNCNQLNCRKFYQFKFLRVNSRSEQVFTHEISSIPVLTKQIMQKQCNYKASQCVSIDIRVQCPREGDTLAAQTASDWAGKDSGPGPLDLRAILME